MKIRHFSSMEEFEDLNEIGEYEVLDIVNRGNRVSADLITECKSYKTVIGRFFKGLENESAFDGWKDCLFESCENGYFKDAESIWNEERGRSEYTGSWAYEVEQLDETLWYITLTVAL